MVYRVVDIRPKNAPAPKSVEAAGAVMHKVYGADGKLIASIPLSKENVTMLNAGVEVGVQYHTPKALQPSLGAKAGRFDLYKDGKQIRTRDVNAVKEYGAIQAAYRALNSQ